MKKNLFCFPFLFLGGLLSAQITNPAPYCISGYTSTSIYPEISKVETATISNTSTHSPSPGYTYYNNISAPIIFGGSTYTVKVTLKNVDAETMLKGWIDYNNDNIFQSTELIISVPQGSVGNGMTVIKQATYTPLPSGFGIRRMRISLGWHYANWGSMTFRLDSCHTPVTGDGSAGETEDYDVNIIWPAGITELTPNTRIKIFPNPVNEILKFDLNKSVLLEDPDIIIYDVINKQIPLQNQYDAIKNELNIAELKSGLYFIQLSVKNQRSVFLKVIKQ